jgi:hypothetical protein
LAPFSVALTADLTVDDDEVGSGRFVVLHNPDGHDAWDGTFRVVTFARAGLDPEMAADPLVTEVGWTWLMECLSVRHIEPIAASGTVTRVSSESFGAMSDRPTSAEIEIRASWTPATHDLSAHLRAWALMTCCAAGLTPMPENVAPLGRRR